MKLYIVKVKPTCGEFVYYAPANEEQGALGAVLPLLKDDFYFAGEPMVEISAEGKRHLVDNEGKGGFY